MQQRPRLAAAHVMAPGSYLTAPILTAQHPAQSLLITQHPSHSSLSLHSPPPSPPCRRPQLTPFMPVQTQTPSPPPSPLPSPPPSPLPSARPLIPASPPPSPGKPLASTSSAPVHSRFASPLPMLQVQASTEATHFNSSDNLQPWLDAARAFHMNIDFDLEMAEQGCQLALPNLMHLMKQASAGKRTIQALGDKIALSRMLDNLGVPQMPMLFEAQRTVCQEKLDKFIQSLEDGGAEAFDIAVKPTHLSDGEGAVMLSKEKWTQVGGSAEGLGRHMEKYLTKGPHDCESEALKSVIPGFIVQPKYKSVLGFNAPLEMKVVTLWGKARLGIWWWGKEETGARKPKRSVWLVRRPRFPDRLDDDDAWESIHEHVGSNPGFEKAIGLFEQAMPTMAAAAEGIATAVGAPFLRSDFFVGSDKYGVRLNEVAYGSGLDVKQKSVGSPRLVDDGPMLAAILQEGMKLCSREVPEHFLSKLGVTGTTYEEMIFSRLPPEKKMQLPRKALRGFIDITSAGLPSPSSHAECETRTCKKTPAASGRSFGMDRVSVLPPSIVKAQPARVEQSSDVIVHNVLCTRIPASRSGPLERGDNVAAKQVHPVHGTTLRPKAGGA